MPLELQPLDVGVRPIAAYRELAGDAAVDALEPLAAAIQGYRVLHLSAAAAGGGVSELLRASAPLLRDLGVEVDWAVAYGVPEDVRAGRSLRDGLQGADQHWPDVAWDVWQAEGARERPEFAGYDAVIAHDVLPLAFSRSPQAQASRWVWRCHLDASEPAQDTWRRVGPLAGELDHAVFSMEAFVPPGLESPASVISPAIDPLGPKNLPLPPAMVGSLGRWVGIDTDRPMIAHVVRLDVWKDPLGVIEAWEGAREKVPGLQLVVVATLAPEDAQGWELISEITAEAARRPDLHLLTGPIAADSIVVNAVQRLARVLCQRSIREGFGLVCAEAMWKGTPVVAEAVGGIPEQVRDGTDGLLIEGVEQCAEAIAELVADPAGTVGMGRSGYEHVRERFLLPRALADELRLYRELDMQGAPDFRAGATAPDADGAPSPPSATMDP
ncbi:MAG: glycosyltransferase [Solirubrobacterales bacterium]